ncbi:MAG: DNA methyltransferase [Phycisphaerales bacterium]
MKKKPLTPAQIRSKPGARAGAGGDRAPAKSRYKKPDLPVFATTLWEYPSQHHDADDAPGKKYTGATPSWVIWQLLQRYTREGDLVVDPFAGSGTTVDVALAESRRALGYDLNPDSQRPGLIFRADARDLPLEDAAADFVFMDPPYSTHVDYTDDERCIGRLDAGTPDEHGVIGGDYYRAMDAVFAEAHRVLKDRRFLALYVSDSYKKRSPNSSAAEFMPIGFELFALLRARFTPVDVIAVVRHNRKLKQGNWKKAAVEQNFFLRGFNYCLIFRKDDAEARPSPPISRKPGKGRR